MDRLRVQLHRLEEAQEELEDLEALASQGVAEHLAEMLFALEPEEEEILAVQDAFLIASHGQERLVDLRIGGLFCVDGRRYTHHRLVLDSQGHLQVLIGSQVRKGEVTWQERVAWNPQADTVDAREVFLALRDLMCHVMDRIERAYEALEQRRRSVDEMTGMVQSFQAAVQAYAEGKSPLPRRIQDDEPLDPPPASESNADQEARPTPRARRSPISQ